MKVKNTQKVLLRVFERYGIRSRDELINVAEDLSSKIKELKLEIDLLETKYFSFGNQFDDLSLFLYADPKEIEEAQSEYLIGNKNES